VEIERPVAWAESGAEDGGSSRISEFAGDVKIYDDPIKLLDDYRPDVLSVGAIYGHNGKYIAEALERGVKQIVSDKPIATTWEQLKRIGELTRDGSAKLLTEFDFRSRKEFRAARDAVRAGQIGRPVLATAQKSYRFGQRPGWYSDRDLFGGLMLWVASHAIDAIRFTTDLRFERVAGRGGNLSQPGYGSMEDHCAALFELEGGATGIVHADYLRPPAAATHGDDRIRVAGTQGVIEVRGGRCVLIGSGGETDITEAAHPQAIHLELLAALRGEASDLYSTELSLELAAVLLCARDAQDQKTWIECAK
jgi:predicted dehydrogenase